MRTAHWKSHLLPLLLSLSLHSVSVCLAFGCTFDGFMIRSGPKSIPTAPQQKTGNDWEPLRIVASTKDLEVASKYCLKNGVLVLKSSATGAEAVCTANLVTLTAEQITTVKSILEKAIALHTDRLLVQRAVGPLKIPDLSKTEGCKAFNVPEEHRTNGVANADMVLYVASVSNKHGLKYSTALGLTCAKSAGGRPIAGTFLFGFDTIEISRNTVRLAAHHIAHALGFSYNEMKLRNMIVNKDVRGKPNPVAVVKSDKTKEMTRARYGCPTADGMELEDGEENDQKLSHWERRNAKDELMAKPVIGLGNLFTGFYTNLTMAAFEDLGYYKANFQMAEHMEYGHNAGCELFTNECMKDGKTKWPNMFCADSESDARQDVCTTDRMGFGFCRLKNAHSLPLPKQFQYFTSNDKKGGYANFLTDYCPVVEQDPSFLCKSSTQQTRMPGSLFGKNSMCLDGNALTIKASGQSVPVRAVCAEISCDGGSVKVKYLGDKDANKWHNCPDGQSLTPSSTSETFVSGTIKCPKYKEVCTVAPDGSSLIPKVTYKPIEPSAGKSPAAPQDPKAPHKPTGKPDGSNSSGKSKDGSSVPFGLIPSVAFLVLSFAGCLIA